MIAIDSNIWIYYLDATTEEHERVRRPMRDALGVRQLFVNGVIPLEVTHHLANRRLDSEQFVREFLDTTDVVVEPVNLKMVRRAEELLQAYPHAGIGGRDASLIAAMERRGISELWTHDGGLKRLDGRLDWLTVHDPVAA